MSKTISSVMATISLLVSLTSTAWAAEKGSTLLNAFEIDLSLLVFCWYS